MVKIHVKYSEINSQDGYDTANFQTYEDFTKWYIDNFRKVTIFNVQEI